MSWQRAHKIATCLLASLWLGLVSPVARGEPAAAASSAEESEAAPTPRVRALHWRGLEALDADEIEKYLRTQEPSWKFWRAKPEFRQEDLDQDLDRIAALYQRYGYFESSAEADLEWSKDGSSVEVTITVDEGPVVELSELEVVLPPDLPVSDAERERWLRELPLETGGVFALANYSDAKSQLLRELADVGRPSASIEGGADVDLETHEASVHWRVVPGPPVFFGAVRLEGLEGVSPETVERELRIEPGARYSADALSQTRERLQGLGLFQWVVVEPVASEASPAAAGGDAVDWPIVIRLTERSPRSVELTVGWGTDDGVRGSAALSHRNFLGDGRRLQLRAFASQIRQGLNVDFTQPYFLYPRTDALTLTSNSTLRREDVPAYEALRFLSRLEVAWQIGGPWSARAGWEFGLNDLSDVDPTADLVLRDQQGTTIRNGPFVGLRRSTLDDPVDTRRGTWIDVSIAAVPRPLGSSVGYMRYLLGLRAFYPVGPVVLAGRLTIGTIDPLPGSSAGEVPLPERLYAGGADSNRGFRFQGLGPKNFDNQPIGGTSVFDASVELRFPIWRKLGGVVFLDAGQVELDPWRFGLDELRFAAGPGLRYYTPVGPLRFDIGWRLNDGRAANGSRVNDRGTYRIHVSIGHAF